jgi:tetratricopeptide (TPR) repeat protein/predicted Ser/Thr protein kinase
MSEAHDLATKAIEADLLGPELFPVEESLAPPKYAIERRLGQGASGVVYLARDTVLDRPVALKFLGAGQSAAFERFRREARFTARLRSPSIVKVFEMDEFAGRPFIAMEYLEGGSLAAAQLDFTQLARALRGVGAALDHAHAQGIVHRDVKPENVLLDAEGRGYVTDFGIARDLSGQVGATLTEEGQVVGTPGYMAPEQARGEPHAVDARTDVYALGATLYYGLVGRRPFDGDSVVEVLHRVIHEDPPFPRSIRPEVPRGLEAIALKCMQKDRRHRYPTMAALVEDLDRFLGGEPVATESEAWFRRLVGARPRPSAPTEIDPFGTIGIEAARELAAWDADRYRISTNVPRTYPALDRLADRLGRYLEERPDAALARCYRSMALRRRGRLDEALEEMERAIDRVGRLPGAHFELGRLYLELHLRRQGEARRHMIREGVEADLRQTREGLRQAALAFEEARKIDGSLPAWQVRYAQAVAKLGEDDFEGCLADCDRILAEDPEVEEVWKLRGDALRFSGKDPFESYGRALEIRRGYYEVLLAGADAHLDRGEVPEARGCLERALEVHPDLAEAEIGLARCALADARVGGGEDSLALASEWVERSRLHGPDDYALRVTRAEILLEKGKTSDGPGPVEEALLDLEKAAGMSGCGHRLQFLSAKAWLLRARHASAAGHDSRPDLDRVLAHAEEPWVTADCGPDSPWKALLEEARQAHASLDGGKTGESRPSDLHPSDR